MAIAIGLLKMLLELQESRRTGALDVAGPGARVRLFVEEGHVVDADEGTVGERLGGLLVRERVLDQVQYTAVLTEQQVRAARGAQVRSKALRALGWSRARFRFIESPGPLALADRFATPVEPIVVAALRLADREGIDVLLAQARDRYAALRGDGATGGGAMKLGSTARIDAFRFQPAEEAFARRLDAARTVRELLDTKDVDGVDRPIILAALLLTDTLDLHATASVGRGAAEEVPSPDAGAGAAPSSRTGVAAAPPSGSEPNSALPVGPETPVAPMAPLLAEKAYQSGKRLVRANRLAEAVAELRRAASLYPAVEYDLWVAWAEARADQKNEDAHADALRAVAERAIKEDVERGFATFVLGHLARRKGQNGTAEALFERARALDPTAIEDAWEVRLRLGPAAPTGTRGEVRALAPLLTTPSAPGVAPIAMAEEEREGSGVATLRGMAAAEALEAVRERGAAEEKRRAEAEAEAEAEANGNAEAKANANADADADADANASANPDADADANASANPDADADADAGDVVDVGRVGVPGDRERAGLPASSGRGWVAGLVVIAGIGGAVFLATGTPGDPTPTADPFTSVRPALPSGASAFTAAASGDPGTAAPATTTASIGAATDASYAAGDAGLPEIDGSRGVLVMPAGADSHRVYIDGRLAGVAPPPIVVGCGRHVVKIGARGREQSVLVPCGGSVVIAYP